MSISPLEAYVHNYLKKEQIIQKMLETPIVTFNNIEYTFEDALFELAKSYGTSTKNAASKSQVTMNLYTMLMHYKEVAFATDEERNLVLKKAHEIANQDKKSITWEQEVLSRNRGK